MHPSWLESAPHVGKGVYKLTAGPREHKHTYHKFCPWSIDGRYVLMFRYGRDSVVGEICVMEFATGETHVLHETSLWTDHMGATQYWQGIRDSVICMDGDEKGRKYISCSRDGFRKDVFRHNIVWHDCTPDGRFLIGRSMLKDLFPNDVVAPRSQTGLFKMDLDTGDCRLLISLEDVVKKHPQHAQIEPLHLYAKQIIIHLEMDRFLFVFGNGDIHRAYNEPRIHTIYTAKTDGSGLRFLGSFTGHPIWHPRELKILANVSDMNGVTRYGLYKDEDRALLDYIPDLVGSGHPSYSPDGRYICTDRYGFQDGERFASVIIAEPATGKEFTIARARNPGSTKQFHHRIEKRPAGQTIVEALSPPTEVDLSAPWVTEAHPAWSRDGRYVVFNCDETGKSQLYLVDMEEAL